MTILTISDSVLSRFPAFTAAAFACDGLADANLDSAIATADAAATAQLSKVDPEAVARARAERQRAITAQPARGTSLPLLPPTEEISANTLITGTVVTGPDGFFAFPVADTAIYWLRAEKASYTYGQREAEIVKERSSATSNIYLTPLDPAVTTCPDSGCTHVNSDGSMQIIVPPGAIPVGETRELSATTRRSSPPPVSPTDCATPRAA